VTELSTGFRGDQDSGKWQVASFKERKYIVFEPKVGSSELHVRQIGSSSPMANAKAHRNGVAMQLSSSSSIASICWYSMTSAMSGVIRRKPAFCSS
jgi:hypothetical protein